MKISTPILYQTLLALFLTIYSPFGVTPFGVANGFAQNRLETVLDGASIAMSLPLTGKYEKLAKQMQFGAKLALENYQKSNPKAQINFFVENDQCTAQGGAIAAQNFIDKNAQIAIGFLCYKAFAAAQDVLAAKNIPTLCPTIRHPHHIQSRAKKGWQSFCFGGNHQSDITASAEIILKRFLGKPYALIDDGSIQARNFIDAIRTIADERGITPIHVDNFRPLQTAQSALIRRLKKTGIKAAFIAGDAADIATIYENINAQNLEIEILGGQNLSVLPFIPEREKIQKNNANLFAIMKTELSNLDAVKKLQQKISQETGTPSIELEEFHILGYAVMEAALMALKFSEKSPQLALQSVLQTTPFKTIIGTIKFNQNGQANPLPLYLQQWENKGWKKMVFPKSE